MRKLLVSALAVLIAVPVFAADPPKADDEKTFYAVGLNIARDLAVFDASPAEFEAVQRGLVDGFKGKPAVEITEYATKIQELALARRKAMGKRLAEGNKAFLENAAKEKGAVKTDSGLIYMSLSEGSGATPKPGSMVKVNYRGMLPDGREFGNSYKSKEPMTITLTTDGVIKCWSEGLQMMKAGGTARWVCPPDIAYGETGVGSTILPYATLVFEVQLLEVK